LIEIEEKFCKLRDEWREDMMFVSSTTERMIHPAYLKIIEMGPTVIPLLLKDMQQNYEHWFHALQVLTGGDPTDPDHPGNIMLLTEAWVKWGYEKGYLK
jgi:hypothetical protein